MKLGVNSGITGLLLQLLSEKSNRRIIEKGLNTAKSLIAIILLTCLCHSPARAQNEITTPHLTSADNFRDIAGISTTYGGTGFANATSYNGIMRTGVFYRSTKLEGLSSNDLATISKLGISRVIDLRTPSEIPPPPYILPYGASFVNFNIYGTNSPITPPVTNLEAVTAYSHSLYQAFVTDAVQRAALRAAFLDLANTPGATLYHCAGGKDRTGWVSTVLESIAGVSTQTIMNDYLATNLYTAPAINAWLTSIPPSLWPIYKPLLGVQSDFLQAALDQVVASYGSMQAYLTQGLGLTQADIYVLRAKMVYYITLPGQVQFFGNADRGAAFLNSLQNSPLSGRYTAYNYYLQSAIDAGTLGGGETRAGGQVHADAAAYLLRLPQLQDDALTPLARGQELKSGQTDAWLSGVAGYQQTSSRSGILGSNDRSSGLIAGGTHRFKDNASAYLGASFIANKSISTNANADIDNYLLISGGRYALSRLETGPYMGVRFSVGSLDYNSTRPLEYGLGTASGKTNGKTYSGRIDFGDIFDAGTFTVTPQVGLLVAHVDLDRFDEHGSELALSVSGISQTIPSLLTELRVNLNGRQLGNWVIKPSAVAGYEHAFDTAKITSTGSLYGYSVSQESAYDCQDLAKLGIGITGQNGDFGLQLGANVLVGENSKSITGAHFNFVFNF